MFRYLKWSPLAPKFVPYYSFLSLNTENHKQLLMCRTSDFVLEENALLFDNRVKLMEPCSKRRRRLVSDQEGSKLLCLLNTKTTETVHDGQSPNLFDYWVEIRAFVSFNWRVPWSNGLVVQKLISVRFNCFLTDLRGQSLEQHTDPTKQTRFINYT